MDLIDYDCDYEVTSSKELVTNLKEKYKFNKDLITHFLYDIAKGKGKDCLCHGNNFDISIDSEKLLRNGVIVDYFIDRDDIGHYTYDKQFYMDSLQLEESEYNLIRFPQRGVCLYKCGIERYNLAVHAPLYKEKLFGKAGGR